MNIKNCAIYTRVSTDNQAEKETISLNPVIDFLIKKIKLWI